MLTSNEEFKLVESLNLKPEHQWLQLLYRSGKDLDEVRCIVASHLHARWYQSLLRMQGKMQKV